MTYNCTTKTGKLAELRTTVNIYEEQFPLVHFVTTSIVMSLANQGGKLISLLSRLDEGQRSQLEERLYSDMVVQCSEMNTQVYAMATAGEDENSPYMCVFRERSDKRKGKHQDACRK